MFFFNFKFKQQFGNYCSYSPLMVTSWTIKLIFKPEFNTRVTSKRLVAILEMFNHK